MDSDYTDTIDFRDLVTDEGLFVDDWTDHLPDDVREELGDSEYLKQIKDPVSLVKSTHGLSKLKGRKLLPGKDAPAEDWDKVWDQMPIPKADESYGLDLESFTDERFKAFAEKTGYVKELEHVMKLAGVPTHLATKIATADAQVKAEQLEAMHTERAERKAALVEALGGERAYESAVVAGRDALSRLYERNGQSDQLKEFTDYLEQTGQADDPRVVHMMGLLAKEAGRGNVGAGANRGSGVGSGGSSILGALPNTSKALGLG